MIYSEYSTFLNTFCTLVDNSMTTPSIGSPAPLFSLPDQDGVTHDLAQYRGQFVLVYFYPKDNTPGCTVEACSFRDNLADLATHDVQVLGISADDVTSHRTFATQHQLTFPLLADTDKQVVTAYGVWKEKSLFGKKYMGIQRDSFLIDPQGVLIHHFEKVKPARHVAEVLDVMKQKTAA